MIRNLLIVAALLLGNLTSLAAADDLPEHQSKNARKVLATLDSIGVNSQYVQNLVSEADGRVERNYFYFNEQEGMGGKIALRYRLGADNAATPANNGKKLELHYAPKDSHMEINARTNGISIGYHFSLE